MRCCYPKLPGPLEHGVDVDRAREIAGVAGDAGHGGGARDGDGHRRGNRAGPGGNGPGGQAKRQEGRGVSMHG
ncbi:MAG: hypothetical protein RSF79_25410 [Janthinobacterium sp.]